MNEEYILKAQIKQMVGLSIDTRISDRKLEKLAWSHVEHLERNSPKTDYERKLWMSELTLKAHAKAKWVKENPDEALVQFRTRQESRKNRKMKKALWLEVVKDKWESGLEVSSLVSIGSPIGKAE
jgi:hypothetical protein